MNLIVALSALALSTAAATPIKLAAPGLTYVGVDQKSGDFFVDYLAQQFRTHGILVTTQSQVAAIIGLERQKSLLGCGETSSECLAELAGALGVDGVITGSLARTGKGSWVINLNVIAANDGRTIGSASTRVRDDDALLDWINEVAGQLAPRLHQQLRRVAAAAPPPEEKKVTRTELPMPPPPGQQLAAQPALQPEPPAAPGTRFGLAKWVVAGAGAAALATGIGFYGAAAVSRSQLDGGQVVISSRAQLNEQLGGIAGLQTISLIATAVGVLAGGAGAALFVLDQPTSVQVTVGPTGGNVSFSWELP